MIPDNRPEKIFFPYDPRLTEKARENRKNATAAEKKMWSEILRNQKTGYIFLRQKPFQHFILDFYCSKLLLGIEVDGDSHAEKAEYDAERTELLGHFGIKIIRYTNRDVMENIEGVFEDLMKQIKERAIELKIQSFGGQS